MIIKDGKELPKYLSLPRFVRLSDLESGRAYLGTPNSVRNSFILLEEKKEYNRHSKVFRYIKKSYFKND